MIVKFTNGNRKYAELSHMCNLRKNEVWGFDLPAGYSCPMASLCLSKAHPDSGKITDGANMVFRCYAASTEAVFTATRNLRWRNFNALKGKSATEMVDAIDSSIPATAKIIRIHSSGDFFSRRYFDAWNTVVVNHPEISFFGYTKVLPYVTSKKPDNFSLVYSYGGKMDSKVNNGTPTPIAYVINTVTDALMRGLPVACVDHPADDYNYIIAQQSFALILHGIQPARAI